MEQTTPAWDAMTAIARLAETMASQQEELRNLVNTLSNNPSKERRVEGMSMPTFSGKKGDSLDLFLDRVLMYLEAKNNAYHASHNQQRVVAMVASHLKVPAASWYYASKSSLTTMDTLAEGLRREFVPIDLQKRLRSELQQLRQRKCTDLDDYIAQFRQLLSQIRGMGDLDQVTGFVQGLVQKTREEVIYRRCQTVSDAMAVAQQYERSHPNNYPDRIEGANRWVQRGRSSARFARPRLPPQSNQPEPMEIGTVQVSREECRRKRLCYYCKQAGHMLNRCPKRGNAPANRRVYVSQMSSNRASHVSTAEAADATPATRVIQFNMARVRVDDRGKPRQVELLRKNAVINGKLVRVLIGSGADTNLIRPGYLTGQLTKRKVNIEGFDGARMENVMVKEGVCEVTLDQQRFSTVNFTEFDLPASHDVILGKPWLTQFNPRIDWITHEITSDTPSVTPTNCFSVLNLSAAYNKVPHRSDECGSPMKVELPDLPPRSTFGFAAIPDMKHAFYIKVKPLQLKSTWPRYVQSILNEFSDVVPDTLPAGLPPHRAVEFEIALKPGAMPQNRALFRLSKMEQDALDIFVADMLEKEWIELSNSPWVSNVFGVPKKNPVTGKAPTKSEWIKAGDPTQPIRSVVDYRFLNSQTLVPKIPIPHIDELFDRMRGAVFFSTLDLAQGYQQMRVKPASRPYTAFRTRTEPYQWCVAPMGCSGMPGIWSHLMRSLFVDFVVVYLDDICAFSRTASEHEKHLHQVFGVLREQQLYVRLAKCEFGQVTIDFLGHTISANGLAVDSKKDGGN